MPRVNATAGPGDGPALLDWPLLAWTPETGVCTEDHQVSVDLIANVHAMRPELDNDHVAVIARTTGEHIRQALNYLKAQES